ENGVRKRQRFRIGGNIDAGHREQVEIDVSLHRASGSANIKIPAAEWKIPRLGWIHHERSGRRQPPPNAGAKRGGIPPAVKSFQISSIAQEYGRRFRLPT